KNGVLLPIMSLLGCYELDAAVAVLRVVPSHEAQHPLACLIDRSKRLLRIGWGVFQRSEQGFRVGVVVTHRRPAERWHNAQTLQSRQHGGAFHGRAVVGM